MIRSDSPELDGRTGAFTAVPPPTDRTSVRSTTHRNWWIDDPDPAAAEGVHPGARSVNRWREDYLRDFADANGAMPAPGAAAVAVGARSMSDEFSVTCPFCGEQVEIYVEPDVRGTFVQDCEVCCNPWRVRVSGRDDDRVVDVTRGRRI